MHMPGCITQRRHRWSWRFSGCRPISAPPPAIINFHEGSLAVCYVSARSGRNGTARLRLWIDFQTEKNRTECRTHLDPTLITGSVDLSSIEMQRANEQHLAYVRERASVYLKPMIGEASMSFFEKRFRVSISISFFFLNGRRSCTWI